MSRTRRCSSTTTTHLAEYEYPAKVRWEQLMVRIDKDRGRDAAQSKLERMGNDVMHGIRWAEVAKAHSDGPTASDGGQFDWTSRGSLASSVLDEAIFALPVGRLSQVLQDDRGVYIVRVIERTDAGRKSFAEVQSEIKKAIEKNREDSKFDQQEKYLARLKREIPVWTVFDDVEQGNAEQATTKAPRIRRINVRPRWAHRIAMDLRIATAAARRRRPRRRCAGDGWRVIPVPDSKPPLRNIELKARLPSLAAAREIAAALATSGPERQHQIDTYFACAQGRFKLREIDGQTAQLVAYARPNGSHPRASDYRLVPVADAAALKAALADALGVQVVVEKQREIYLHHNVRIHLDEVLGLGTFLEFEAVLDQRA